MPDYKIILGAIAVVMTIIAHLDYMRAIIRGTNRPHLFTWIIWTLLTVIILAAQISDNAGPGAWSTLAVLVPCVAITLMAIKSGEKNITKSDWAMFMAGLASIPVWLLTSNPFWSVIIVCLIDALAFGPTFRKAWFKPHEEATFMYGFNVPRHMLSVAAIANYSLVTTLYPAMLVFLNALMYIMIKLRRRTK
ncbi:MAG: hypothetical protein EBQ96_07675 [Proteobacteria bacterium]|nr:hypothetical protein [Pseudomonadota bacterium]